MVIELKNIVKRFGQNTVVNHVDLTIGDGEFFTLLGPSGCGKTTLLRMIAGFNDPDEGDILFGGESILHLPAHKRDTGMVFQNYALFPHLSVEENVAYGLRARGIKGQEVKDRVKDILEAVQLGDMASRYPRQLSGGQQQRVALARALVIRPRVLLMDEPLSNLDAKLRVSMREEIRRIQQNLGITTVYVTHDQEEAMAVSDRIAIFYAGHLQQVASPAAIYFTPANRFTAEFMGSCNILETQCTAFDAASETAKAVSAAIAEEGVIRLLYLEPALGKEAGLPAVQEFSSPALGHIYGVLLERIARGSPISTAALSEELSGEEMSLLVSILQKPELLSKASQTLRDYINKMREQSAGGSMDLRDLLASRQEKEKDMRDKYGR